MEFKHLFDVWNNAHPDDTRDLKEFVGSDDMLKRYPHWIDTDGDGTVWVKDTVFANAAQGMDESLFIRAFDIAYELPESALCRIMDTLGIPQADPRFDEVVGVISRKVYGDDRKEWVRTDMYAEHSERETIREMLVGFIPDIHNGMDYDTFLNELKEAGGTKQ